MANRSAITISTSRFAVLKVEDDEDFIKPTQKTAQEQQQNSSASSAKKKNKKKKEQTHKETEQLKNLAFGKGGTSGGGGGGKHTAPKEMKAGGGDSKNWTQWRELDSAAVEEQFRDDLAQAILQSKLDNEKKKQDARVLKERIEAGIEEPKTKNERKKKKQKEKPQAMSLEQFKQLPPEKPVRSDSEEEETSKVPVVHTRVPATERDPSFFNSVKDDAAQILRQEKMQEEYRKQYASQNIISAKLKSSLEAKDKEITELKSQLEKMEAELKQVKKRNKQLCVILAQGEMKDKAQVLLQVDELTVVKDELTEQVTTLTAAYEKEKSKNHALKTENDKLKASKHGK